MRGKLDLGTLNQRIEDGELDTVVCAFPDMFGRLIGKRVTGSHFMREVAEHGMHVCDYLLGCDVEMDPVPGYKVTSWERGYGDFNAVPDLRTLRELPWLEKTALVLCDLSHEDGAPVAVAPRQILRRQVDRARALGFFAM